MFRVSIDNHRVTNHFMISQSKKNHNNKNKENSNNNKNKKTRNEEKEEELGEKKIEMDAMQELQSSQSSILLPKPHRSSKRVKTRSRRGIAPNASPVLRSGNYSNESNTTSASNAPSKTSTPLAVVNKPIIHINSPVNKLTTNNSNRTELESIVSKNRSNSSKIRTNIDSITKNIENLRLNSNSTPKNETPTNRAMLLSPTEMKTNMIADRTKLSSASSVAMSNDSNIAVVGHDGTIRMPTMDDNDSGLESNMNDNEKNSKIRNKNNRNGSSKQIRHVQVQLHGREENRHGNANTNTNTNSTISSDPEEEEFKGSPPGDAVAMPFIEESQSLTVETQVKRQTGLL